MAAKLTSYIPNVNQVIKTAVTIAIVFLVIRMLPISDNYRNFWRV